jgi:hypothetical protein
VRSETQVGSRDLRIRSVLALYLLGVGIGASMARAQAPGMFTATGNMTAFRYRHSATLLQDGRVLIAGGITQNTAPPFGQTVTATAELYDPATGTFVATGSMSSARASHTATLLPDGRVLIAAGSGGGSPPLVGPEYSLVRAELYDPSTGTFTATGDMTTPSIVRNEHSHASSRRPGLDYRGRFKRRTL